MTCGILLWLGLIGGTASAAEYRKVHLNNGREILAEVKEFTPKGIKLGIPQGTMVFPPEDLKTMEPLTEADYRSQRAWRVVILNFTASDPSLASEAKTAHMLARRALNSIPGVVSGTPADIPVTIREAERKSLAACRTDLLCAIREGDAAGVDVVLLGQLRESDGKKELRLGALWVKNPTARKRLSLTISKSVIDHREEVYSSQRRLLSLQPSPVSLARTPAPVKPAQAPVPVPVVRKPPAPRPTPTPRPPRTPPSAAKVRALAWAPVPGLPHLIQGDHGGFARTLGVASVGATLGIGMAGHATYTRGQFIAVSVLSTYAMTTLANHLFWPESLQAQPPPR